MQQLELQLAQYNTLLAAAEGTAQMPSLAVASPGASPSASRACSPRGRRAAAGGSPMQAAMAAVQLRRAAEEAAALREQLKAAQVEVASTRRCVGGGERLGRAWGREPRCLSRGSLLLVLCQSATTSICVRASMPCLPPADWLPSHHPGCRRERESRARRQQLEAQLSNLAAGLGTVQSLLKRQGLEATTGRASASSGRASAPTSPAGKAGRGGTVRRSKEGGMQGGSAAAMAALSALLRSLQAEGTASSSAVVSPQASEGAEASAPSAGALPRGPSAEKRSDPLEQAEEEQAGEEQAEEESLDVEALLPGDAAQGGCGSGSGQGEAAGVEPATPLAPLSGTPQCGGTTIPAEWHRQGGSAASARGRSRIPLPPPAGSARAKPSPLTSGAGAKPEPLVSAATSPKSSPAPGSAAAAAKLTRSPHVGSASPGRGIKALFGCGHPRPQATLSSSQM